MDGLSGKDGNARAVSRISEPIENRQCAGQSIAQTRGVRSREPSRRNPRHSAKRNLGSSYNRDQVCRVLKTTSSAKQRNGTKRHAENPKRLLLRKRDWAQL